MAFAIPLDVLKSLVDFLPSVANWVHNGHEQSKVQTKEALESLMKAVTETRQYLAILRTDPGRFDLQRQARLSSLWIAAGVAMAPINGNIASTYLMKADYWSDPEGWQGTADDSVLIELDNVFEAGTNALLHLN
jgi:hypothetical protein